MAEKEKNQECLRELYKNECPQTPMHWSHCKAMGQIPPQPRETLIKSFRKRLHEVIARMA